MTLDRVLSRFGLASRTEARNAVRAGRLKVNGRVERDPDRWVRPDRDVFHLDGERLKAARKIYLLFYKPKGVITSHGDPKGRRTIYDCLGEERSWVSPVGRLDKDTSGLLLLTNDTDLANNVTDPKFEIPKGYVVKASGIVSDEVLARLREGVDLGRGERAVPRTVRRLEDRGKYSWIEIVLTEGKNREIRRMLEAVGFSVLKLVRTRIGPLTIGDLQVGRWRALSRLEIQSLLRSGKENKESIGRTKQSI